MVTQADNNDELEKSIDAARRNDQRVNKEDRFDGKSKITVVPVNSKQRITGNFDIHAPLYKISQAVPHREKTVRNSDPCQVCQKQVKQKTFC